MKRQFNNFKKLFDGRGTSALNEVFSSSDSGKGVVVLRAKSTTDVIESTDEKPELPDVSNR